MFDQISNTSKFVKNTWLYAHLLVFENVAKQALSYMIVKGFVEPGSKRSFLSYSVPQVAAQDKN